MPQRVLDAVVDVEPALAVDDEGAPLHDLAGGHVGARRADAVDELQHAAGAEQAHLVRLVLDVQAVRLLVRRREEARRLRGVGARVRVQAERVALLREEVVVDGRAFLAAGPLAMAGGSLSETYEDCTVRTIHWAPAGAAWGAARAPAAKSEAMERNFILIVRPKSECMTWKGAR